MKTKATQIYGSITAVICLLISLNAVSAEQYEKGHGALQYFDAQGTVSYTHLTLPTTPYV